jgi:hypothetical protein
MAMPIASMINFFRDEFEEHIENARRRADAAVIGSAAGPSALEVA